MRTKYLNILVLIAYSGMPLALDDDARVSLHRSSQNIDNTVNRESVVDSLYQQIRPKANVTNTSLNQKQIDIKVRQYIADKYAPALIMNYKLIYSQLRDEGAEFSDCRNVNPINSGEDILKALCLSDNNGVVKVSYMTNGYSQGWKSSAIFVFSSLNGELQLTSIELQLKDDVKAYVEGI